MLNHFSSIKFFCVTAVLLLSMSCAPEPEKREAVLYHQYCASCHIAPTIEELPKNIWEDNVLPDMMARMDIEELLDITDRSKTTFRPTIKLADWVALRKYIIELAPDELPKIPVPKEEELVDFMAKTLQLDGENGALYSYLEFSPKENSLYAGDIYGSLKKYDFESQSITTIFKGKTPITWYNRYQDIEFITEVGILDPSERSRGKIISKQGLDTVSLIDSIHRPIHNLVEDLNGDGNLEMVISEFGNERGKLSLAIKTDTVQYEKKVLLNQPGCIRTIAKDMDKDGMLDLVVMTSQGNESITILYQQDDLIFRAKKVLEFSPVYGSSWFELIDYNGDGHDDIITVNGDNADKSYVHKPYHGMRIHLNDGQNNFEEVFFYPLNGATRVLAHDFDEDGDIDFGLISTFPDYERMPQFSFVYLENYNTKKYRFNTKILERPNAGRWFLMDKGDIDNDGDMDILLSSFTYVFTPVPKDLSTSWSETNTDVLVLENQLR